MAFAPHVGQAVNQAIILIGESFPLAVLSLLLGVRVVTDCVDLGLGVRS